MTEKFIYQNPKNNLERDKEPIHTLELEINGKIIGTAEIEYFSKPFPFYQISHIGVDYPYKGQGYGSKMMDFIENFLREMRRAGVLLEAIDPDSPAAGMYARRGWQELPDSDGVHAYNLPKDIPIEILINYERRQTDITARPKWKDKSTK